MNLGAAYSSATSVSEFDVLKTELVKIGDNVKLSRAVPEGKKALMKDTIPGVSSSWSDQ